jgi:hypothetical protein
MQIYQFDPHLRSQRGVEVGEWLVEREDVLSGTRLNIFTVTICNVRRGEPKLGEKRH